MLVEGFRWCLPAEGLAGSAVDHGGDCFDLFGGPAREVGALGEVLAQQLVGAALPGALRVGEVDGGAVMPRPNSSTEEMTASSAEGWFQAVIAREAIRASR